MITCFPWGLPRYLLWLMSVKHGTEPRTQVHSEQGDDWNLDVSASTSVVGALLFRQALVAVESLTYLQYRNRIHT